METVAIDTRKRRQENKHGGGFSSFDCFPLIAKELRNPLSISPSQNIDANYRRAAIQLAVGVNGSAALVLIWTHPAGDSLGLTLT